MDSSFFCVFKRGDDRKERCGCSGPLAEFSELSLPICEGKNRIQHEPESLNRKYTSVSATLLRVYYRTAHRFLQIYCYSLYMYGTQVDGDAYVNEFKIIQDR